MVRHKNRYMIIEIKEDSRRDAAPLQISTSSIHHSVMEVVQRLHGDFGVASVTQGLMTKYCNEKTRIAVVRCRHGPHKLVASSLPFVKYIKERRVHIHTLYVGATIRRCFKFIKRHQERKFDEYCVGVKSEEEQAELRKAIMNLDSVLNIR